MTILKKKELHFVIIIFIGFLFFFLLKKNFWDYLIVPKAINDFTDFRCVASWSRLFENITNTAIIYTDTEGCRLNYPRIWVFISDILEINHNTF